jgi:hypothetical protein
MFDLAVTRELAKRGWRAVEGLPEHSSEMTVTRKSQAQRELREVVGVR